jgi:CHRD domain
MNRETMVNRKRSILIITAAMLSSLLFIAASDPTVFVFAKPFTALMSGNQEVPPVENSAVGKATFRTKSNDTWIDYKINITGFSDATAAHIHLGKSGANGDILVDLLTGKKENPTRLGMAIRGNITDPMLAGPMQGKPLADLISAINNGDTYVNVHTQSNPDGEIRGQIQPGDLNIAELNSSNQTSPNQTSIG